MSSLQRIFCRQHLFYRAARTQARCLSISAPKFQHANAVAQHEDEPEMPDCDFKPMTYQGKPYDKVLQIRKENLHPSLFSYYKKPLLVSQGYKQWVFDDRGKRYMDLFAGIVTVSIGHCHPRATAAAHEQIDRLWHTTNIYMNDRITEIGEKLVAKLPGNLKVVYFVNSGAEANDLALLMARAHTKAFDIINLRNSYHGASSSLLGLLSQSNWKQDVPIGFGQFASANPDVYRGHMGGKYCRDSPVQADRECNCTPGHCKASDYYIDQLQEILDYQVSNKIAGIFAEPIQGVGGTVQYPKNYLQRAYEKVREKGGVCIADEVQTGFGRTGEHFWGFEGHGVMPDIVTMAKGIANGLPMAAVITTPEIAKSITVGLHMNTFGGNPISCNVASAVLDVIEEENLQQNCADVGTYFLQKLATLRDEFPIVGDVRGKGLMIGVEMVADKESRKPLPANVMADIWESTKENGILIGKGGRFGNVFRIKPPMIITKADADFAHAVLRKSIRSVMEQS